MTEEAQRQTGHAQEQLVDANERSRGRARSIATLTAAAAGALGAGLVFAPSTTLSVYAQRAGALAVALLLVATAAFVIASTVHVQTAHRSDQKLRVGIMPWRVLVPHEDDADQPTRKATAGRIQSRIAALTNVAMFAAALAGASLVGAVSLATFKHDISNVHVTVSDPSDVIHACPRFADDFPATVSQASLEGDSPELPVHLTARACRVDHDVIAYVPRSGTEISIER